MVDQNELSGLGLCREGAGMLSTLYPDPATHAAASQRLYAKGQKLIHSGNPQLQTVGFFIHGLSRAAAGKGLMASVSLHPAYVPPMPAVARILAQFDRKRLAGFIEVAIGLLDVMEGDPEIEANGDEQDGDFAEDEAGIGHLRGCGPGCSISDPDEDDSEDCCMAGDDLARSGPIVLDRHWAWEASSGRQPGDADEHEPWQASRETEDHRE